jgi:crotonobetainyl-CoA:carnitine CoA-transferase CaiB-like acyl-CoA transferase
MAGIPVKFSATPASVRLPPPLLGQHTEEILSSWIGMKIDEINELRGKKVIESRVTSSSLSEKGEGN